MDILDNYKDIERQIHEYFGYKEDWRIFPISDETESFWSLNGEGPGEVHLSLEECNLRLGMKTIWPIYTQRHLPKWVYRGNDYTMIVVDTQTDGNKFLAIFDNKKERPFVDEADQEC